MASTLLNLSRWISGGFAEAAYAISSSGRPYDASTAVEATTGADVYGMTVLKGAKTANIQIPQAEILQIPGDDGVRGVIQFPGNALPTFDMVFSDLTMSFANAMQGTITDDVQSVYDFLLLDPENRSFPDIFLQLTRRAVATEPGSTGNGYETVLFLQSTVSFAGPSGFSTGANAGEYTFNVAVNRTSILPWGEPLTIGAHGSSAASGFIFWSEQVPTFDVAIKDGVVTDWTLSKTLASNAQAITFKTVSGTTSSDTATVDAGNNQVDSVAAGASGNILTIMYEKVTG
jgi:hypothetical protein